MNGDILVESFKNMNLKEISIYPLIVIYDSPIDYPNDVVLRLWNLDELTKYICKIDCIDRAFEYVPDNMTYFEKCESDNEYIVGTFI